MTCVPERKPLIGGLILSLLSSIGALALDATIEVWPPQGVYTNFVSIVLFTERGRAHYTLDGTEPGSESEGYRIPIFLTSSTVIKAAPFLGDDQIGPVVEQRFTIVTNEEAAFTSELPALIVSTAGIPIPFQDRVPAMLTLLAPVNGQTTLRSPAEYSGRIEIATRGNSSRDLPKKSYRVELQDEDGEDLKVPMLGLPRESDWILLAAYNDRTLIRDALAYSLWRQMGHYAPRFRFVELFVVETNRASVLFEPSDYKGVYVLLEKIKRGKQRLAIDKLEPKHLAEPEITGGYIFKRDRPDPGELGFKTTSGIRFLYVEPKDREIPDAQRQWLTNHVNELEAAVMGPRFLDPEAGYKSYLDTASFVDYHWLVELGRNVDGYGVSIYLHKPRGGPVKMGPVWDWDLSFGNILVQRLQAVDGWQFDTRKPPPLYRWYARLFEDPDFLQAYIDRWSELRRTVFSETNLMATVDALARQVANSQHRNYQRWPTLLGFGRPAGADLYAEQVAGLKSWIRGRAIWIESQCMPPPAANWQEDAAGSIVQLLTESGTVYYTLDGQDPRMAGGDVSPAANEYHAPIRMPGGTALRARVRSPFGLWSAPVMVQR